LHANYQRAPPVRFMMFASGPLECRCSSFICRGLVVHSFAYTSRGYLVEDRGRSRHHQLVHSCIAGKLHTFTSLRLFSLNTIHFLPSLPFHCALLPFQVGGGRTWKMDWNFEIVKHIKNKGGSRQIYAACFMVMDEYNDILMNTFTHNKSWVEVKPLLLALQNR
jgi:hypothetical protein